MLTDMIVEEDFDQDGEHWYSQQELERDLHLAAELGKTLLDRNHELESALQQMYSTNQEQLQEIEYLNKQVDLLRQMNDQQAKVYEQLDTATRELEQGKQRLVKDNRLAQQKINQLTETVDGLQVHMEDLQAQLEELKAAQTERGKREQAEQRAGLTQSVSCLKELYDLHRDSHPPRNIRSVDSFWASPSSFYDRDVLRSPEEAEHAALQRSIHSLQRQIGLERSMREEAEQESHATASENRELERQLAALEGCQARRAELEAEVEQLRLQWRADCANSARRPEQLLMPDIVFLEPVARSAEGGEEEEEEGRKYSRQRCHSDSVVRSSNAEEIRRGHEQMCIRRTEAVKQRGISLLNEVDAQYSALQVKYEELLQRCQQAAQRLDHKGVQTSAGPCARRRSAATSELTAVAEEGEQPEYKALFKEIFSRIQRSKADLSENRRSGGPVQ